MISRANRPDYGMDAPPVIRNLLVAGFGSIVLSFFVAQMPWGPAVYIAFGLLWMGPWFILSGILMILSSRFGKYREREHLVDLLELGGIEWVLDVGCGRGLILNEVASRLSTGKAVGIDIWQASDLSGNSPEVTQENARREGVEDRVEVLSADVRDLPFDDASFDCVTSSMCIHNIASSEERAKAMSEIMRVLKPGGSFAIMDFRNTQEYVDQFKLLGALDVMRSGLRFRLYPPSRIVTGIKPRFEGGDET